MGGRGSSWGGTEKPLGDTSRGNERWTGDVGTKIPASGHLREAIGEKGQAYSIDEAIKKANPYYSALYSEYSANCQRAVVAYELLRRGYSVQALPTYKNDILPSYAGGNGNGHWQQAFKGAKRLSVGESNPKTAQANLEREMKKWGNGSRAIVSIPGHVFNAENVHGKIRYIDAQTATKYSSKNVFSRLGSSAKSVAIIRTDNLRISDRARESVTVSQSARKRRK